MASRNADEFQDRGIHNSRISFLLMEDCLLQIENHLELQRSAASREISKSRTCLICSYLKLRYGSAGFFPIWWKSVKLLSSWSWKTRNDESAEAGKSPSWRRRQSRSGIPIPGLLPGGDAAVTGSISTAARWPGGVGPPST